MDICMMDVYVAQTPWASNEQRIRFCRPCLSSYRHCIVVARCHACMHRVMSFRDSHRGICESKTRHFGRIHHASPVESYTEGKLIEQPYASRGENVNPFNVFAYIGRIDLLPQSDNWIDTRRLPVNVIDI